MEVESRRFWKACFGVMCGRMYMLSLMLATLAKFSSFFPLHFIPRLTGFCRTETFGTLKDFGQLVLLAKFVGLALFARLIPEPRRHLAKENKVADEDGLRLLCQHLGLENLQIVTLFRLGRQATGKCRPLKVVLQSKTHRKYLLDNDKFIKDKATENMKYVIIVRDLTLVQRQERRNRLANRDVRVQNNEVRGVSGASSNQDSHN